MSSTICKYLAGEIRGNGRLYSYCLESTKSDPTWKPSAKGSGRSMIEQADECAKLNHGVASLLRSEEMTLSQDPIVSDPKTASEQVMASANDLADALQSMQDSDLDRMIQLPFGTYPAKFAASIASSNMVYHWGQANYIETLDGDAEFRIPPEFVNN